MVLNCSPDCLAAVINEGQNISSQIYE